MLTKLCNWQHSAQWRLLSRRRPGHFFHHSSGGHGNSHKHLRLFEDISLIKNSQGSDLNYFSICFWSNVCRLLSIRLLQMYHVTAMVHGFVGVWVSSMWLSSLTNNPINLTLFGVGDLHHRIWSIILRNRLQVSPLLSVSETQKHEGGFPG